MKGRHIIIKLIPKELLAPDVNEVNDDISRVIAVFGFTALFLEPKQIYKVWICENAFIFILVNLSAVDSHPWIINTFLLIDSYLFNINVEKSSLYRSI